MDIRHKQTKAQRHSGTRKRKVPLRRATLSLCLCVFVFNTLLLVGADHRGQVTFGGVPVPGATVTATQGNQTFVAITDPQGAYLFPGLPDGNWAIQVEMAGFGTLKGDN